MLYSGEIKTPLGSMVAAATDAGLCLLEFADRRELAEELRHLQKKLGVAIRERPGHAVLIQIRDELRAYFAGGRRSFRTPIREPLIGTEFQRSIWNALRKIPRGETRSYLQLAESIGNVRAVRAVGAANGANRMAIIFPCHRVIGSDGGLTGYAGGLERKRRLLELEGFAIERSQVRDGRQSAFDF
ncbi:MAG: methylated-DNA--[protein]-cysteine S-methyltransferase [Leptospirales bacterium]|jgi:methylated-DNA-[protein]-cysteine S-methyltransferase